MKADVTTLGASKAGTVELAEAIFGLKPRPDLIQRMVRYQLLKRLAGTHHAQDRSEVNVTGKKMYKQKGTGGARHGDKSVPQWRGGGKAFGPKPREPCHRAAEEGARSRSAPRALCQGTRPARSSCSTRPRPRTARPAALRDQFAKLEWSNVLIIDGAELEAGFVRAARNLPNIDVLPVQGINVYDILRRSKLVLTKAAIAALEERFADAVTAPRPREASR